MNILLFKHQMAAMLDFVCVLYYNLAILTFVPLFRKDWKYFGINSGSLFVFAVIATLLIPDDFLRPVKGTASNLFWAFSIIVFRIKDRVFTKMAGCLLTMLVKALQTDFPKNA